MAEILIHIFKGFLGLLFPQKCLGCGAPDTPLCNACLAQLPPSFSTAKQWIFAATSYDDETVKKAVRFFKYHNLKILAEPLGALVFRKNKRRYFQIHSSNRNKFSLIPIPLSRKRLKQRGYNQSELLGKFLSDKLSVKMRADILYKIKETPSQVEIKDREKRLKNLQGAFAVKKPEAIKNKMIILVDDITTTGATLNEAKRALTQSGAKRVIGLVIAKG